MKHARLCTTALLGATLFASAAPASAAIYDLTGTSATGPAGQPEPLLSFRINVDDPVTYGGIISFEWAQAPCGPGVIACIPNVNKSSLLGFDAIWGGTTTRFTTAQALSLTVGYGDVIMAFNPDQTLKSLRVDEFGQDWDFSPMIANSQTWSAKFNSDPFLFCAGCSASGTVSGPVVSAPEPGTLAILGVGLFGLAGCLSFGKTRRLRLSGEPMAEFC